jgi:uncharacterized membrane protein YidH (DUF202 family)
MSLAGEKAVDEFVRPDMEHHNKGTTMTKSISVALLAGGILLLIFGINAYNSSSSDISRFFTGSATDKSIWMLVGGVIVTVLGLVGLLRGSKKV